MFACRASAESIREFIRLIAPAAPYCCTKP
jgi:hypothetical protein